MIRLRLKQLWWWRQPSVELAKTSGETSVRVEIGLLRICFVVNYHVENSIQTAIHERKGLLDIRSFVKRSRRAINWPVLNGTRDCRIYLTPTLALTGAFCCSRRKKRALKMHAQVQRMHLHSNCIVSFVGKVICMQLTSLESASSCRRRPTLTSLTNVARKTHERKFFTRFSRIVESRKKRRRR